jgi:hypothetical protein
MLLAETKSSAHENRSRETSASSDELHVDAQNSSENVSNNECISSQSIHHHWIVVEKLPSLDTLLFV